MKRWLMIIFIILAQVVLVTRACEAARTFTGTFKMSVTIPAIIGVNAPMPPSITQGQIVAGTLTKNDVSSNVPVDIIMSEGLQGDQKVMFQTLVAR